LRDDPPGCVYFAASLREQDSERKPSHEPQPFVCMTPSAVHRAARGRVTVIRSSPSDLSLSTSANNSGLSPTRSVAGSPSSFLASLRARLVRVSTSMLRLDWRLR